MSTVASLPPPTPLAAEDPFHFGWRYIEETGSDGTVVVVRVPLTENDVLHPQEGDFIMNTPLHNRICAYMRFGMHARFPGRADVVALGDTRIDWGVVEGLVHGPDNCLLEGVRPGWDPTEGTFRIAKNGGRPLLVVEVTSPATRANDFAHKMREYFRVGIPLYVIVDLPWQDEPPTIDLYGFKAGPRQFEALPLNDQGRLWLEPVGLWLIADGLEVYLEDAAGQRVPDYTELVRLNEEAQTRLKELESEVARLRNPSQS